MVSYMKMEMRTKQNNIVLILIVVEDGLVPSMSISQTSKLDQVLILIVVEDGLVQALLPFNQATNKRLNPYCSGRWSRTRPYKTLLIINKLKNFTKQVFTFLNRKLTIS